ncbi:MAG: IS110 family transposase [Akkermansiaceae bacterium]|nr:IS110 family transposase [Akkermansiaceae bacterium]NNM28331.1 IS110 family transposase [Akkermansiaceae bacterium]
MPGQESFFEPRRLAAFAGVTPRHHSSGTSGRVRTPMSKAGCRRLRKALFFPAMSAMRHNAAGQHFAQRLREKGKPPLVIIGAWTCPPKSRQPFNPNHRAESSATA